MRADDGEMWTWQRLEQKLRDKEIPIQPWMQEHIDRYANEESKTRRMAMYEAIDHEIDEYLELLAQLNAARSMISWLELESPTPETAEADLVQYVVGLKWFGTESYDRKLKWLLTYPQKEREQYTRLCCEEQG